MLSVSTLASPWRYFICKNSTTSKRFTFLTLSTRFAHINILSSYSNIYPTRCNLRQFILSGNCSTCFGWYFHPTSGAHTTVSTASGICHAVTAICRYRGRVRTGLSVLWVAYAFFGYVVEYYYDARTHERYKSQFIYCTATRKRVPSCRYFSVCYYEYKIFQKINLKFAYNKKSTAEWILNYMI
jgi:hypothetical protein